MFIARSLPSCLSKTSRCRASTLLESPGFARNERLSRFLRFLVERSLDGRDHELKESVIGTEVFGRKAGYSPKRDPIVRTEARRLRERLSQYYDGPGKSNALKIELPKGGYVPVFRTTATRPAAPALRKRYGLVASLGLLLALAVGGVVRFAANGRVPANSRSAVLDLYQRARAFEKLAALSGVESSIDLFRQITIKDPSFAPGYAGLATGYAARSGFDRFDAAERADMISRGWLAAARAVRLDPRSADAQDALAMMQARQAQWGLAERSFRRAIGLAPSDPLWRAHFAIFLLLPLGRVEEAIQQLQSAEELDPLSAQIHGALSMALLSTGQFDEAIFHCQKAAETDQQRSVCWAQTLLHQGKTEQAVQILEVSWKGHLLEPGAHILGIAYAKAGRRDDAERMAAMLPRPASKAQIFAALGDKERTFELLDRMVPMGPARIGRDLISPNFAFNSITIRSRTCLPR